MMKQVAKTQHVMSRTPQIVVRVMKIKTFKGSRVFQLQNLEVKETCKRRTSQAIKILVIVNPLRNKNLTTQSFDKNTSYHNKIVDYRHDLDLKSGKNPGLILPSNAPNVV